MREKVASKQFTIVKFEEDNILLVNRVNRKAYQYLGVPLEVQLLPQISHPVLVRPILYGGGLLYPRGVSNLSVQLQTRARAHEPAPYAQEELLNTFQPLLECLRYVHDKGVVHGAICPNNVIIEEDGTIKLKDWMACSKDNPYYFGKQRKQIQPWDDIVAFGQVLTQAATLRKGCKPFFECQLAIILECLIETYSKGFLFAVTVLLMKDVTRFNNLLSYFHNEQILLGDAELNFIYSNAQHEKEKKKISMATLDNVVNSFKPLALGESPTKKITLTTPLRRKDAKDDVENKKEDKKNPDKRNTINEEKKPEERRDKDDARVGQAKRNEEGRRNYNQQAKKKQIDKINKIIERSNEFVNELMARKNNDQALKRISGKTNFNSSFIADVAQRKQKQSNPYQLASPYATPFTASPVALSPFVASPVKKLRTISKRK